MFLITPFHIHSFSMIDIPIWLSSKPSNTSLPVPVQTQQNTKKARKHWNKHTVTVLRKKRQLDCRLKLYQLSIIKSILAAFSNQDSLSSPHTYHRQPTDNPIHQMIFMPKQKQILPTLERDTQIEHYSKTNNERNNFKA